MQSFNFVYIICMQYNIITLTKYERGNTVCPWKAEIHLELRPSVPDPRGGGMRGTCPPPPKRPKVPLKTTKNLFFHVLRKEKVGEGAQIEL